LVEQRIENPRVGGSIPPQATSVQAPPHLIRVRGRFYNSWGISTKSWLHMSLLADIQFECTAERASVSRLLRLCLQLASRLKHDPFKGWALHELNGYPKDAELPPYRIVETRSPGFFADRFIGQVTFDIPMSILPEPLRSRFLVARLDQPISQYEELLSEEGGFSAPWPQELALHYGKEVSPIQCLRMWQELPRSGVASLIDTVKTRVLSMVLDIKAENPDAGDIQGPGAVPIPEAKVAQIFNTNIYGGTVQNLAAGSTDIVQTATVTVAAGNLGGLLKFIADQGVAPTHASELAQAVEADTAAGAKGIGPRVADWLARLPAKAGSATAKIGSGALIALITKGILQYFGLGD
jgi:hypothetical protein